MTECQLTGTSLFLGSIEWLIIAENMLTNLGPYLINQASAVI